MLTKVLGEDEVVVVKPRLYHSFQNVFWHKYCFCLRSRKHASSRDLAATDYGHQRGGASMLILNSTPQMRHGRMSLASYSSASSESLESIKS